MVVCRSTSTMWTCCRLSRCQDMVDFAEGISDERAGARSGQGHPRQGRVPPVPRPAAPGLSAAAAGMARPPRRPSRTPRCPVAGPQRAHRRPGRRACPDRPPGPDVALTTGRPAAAGPARVSRSGSTATRAGCVRYAAGGAARSLPLSGKPPEGRGRPSRPAPREIRRWLLGTWRRGQPGRGRAG